jgi:hypothetical protein
MPASSSAGNSMPPVTAAHAMIGADAPAPPPITMFCGVRRLSHTV